MLRSNAMRLGLLFLLAALFAIPACDTLVTENNETTVYDPTIAQDCLSGCHSDNNNLVTVPRGQWENSAHASHEFIEATVTLNGEEFNTSNSDGTCGASCHSSEGYINTVLTGSASPITTTSPIGCYTCHMPHTGDYGKWRIDTLRGESEFVMLNSELNHTYQFGKSNMCVNCHQAANPAPTGTDPVTLTGDWGPHFSPQAEVFAGVGGARFGVVEDIISHDSTRIKAQDGCISCHFGYPAGRGAGYTFGEHTFRLEEPGNHYVENCNADGACHGDAPLTDFYSSTTIKSIITLADEIHDTLWNRNFLDTTDQTGMSFVSGTTLPANNAQVLYNYLLYRGDGSQGVHNPQLMLSLMEETVNQLALLAPTAKFELTYDFDTLTCAPWVVALTNLSEGNIDTIIWDFGNGKGDTATILSDAVVQYPEAGTYTISITATGPGGSDTYSLTNLVTVETKPNPSFTADVQTACAGDDSLQVQFTDQSEFAVSWLWDFGDGSPTETLENPSHTYDTISGNYTVTLIVDGFCGSDTLVSTDFIKIWDDSIVPVAVFAADTLAGDTLHLFSFTNSSTDSDSWLWDFGDGSSDSTATTFNATHTFKPTVTTIYTVSLTASNGCSSNTTTIDITINVP